MVRSVAVWVTRLLAVLLGVAAGAPAQDLKYEKYTLDNGMTVILHEDHSLPIVAVNTWFRVGSKDEPPGRSGFAHLFEHLMFMGTQRVPAGEFDALMEAGGGSNNASTGSDTTNYYSSGPAALLPTLLWLDADRLEDLGRMTDQEKLDRQRDVVRNERRQSYENQPYGRVELVTQELMYPPGHPYHLPVIGTHADLVAATVPDVKDFFATYYVPSNASLCVAGDFDPARIKALISDLFGTLPRGAPVPRRTAEPVRLASVKRATLLDQVDLPMVTLVYHSPPRFAPGDAELGLLASVLAEGKTSRLYRRLVYEDQTAVEVSASQESMQLGSLFHVTVMAKPDANVDRIEHTMDEEINRLLESGPAPEELERHKATFELAMVSRLEGLGARADLLNEYEYFLAEPNSFQRDLERYQTASVEGVQRWAHTVLTPDARLILRVLPEEPERPESPRDHRPAELGPPPFQTPVPEAFTLSNGLPVLLWQRSDLPLVAVELVFHPGRPLDEPAQAGLAAVTAAMLSEGAGERNALEFSDALQSLGATLTATADQEALDVSLTVLKRHLEPAVLLTSDAVRRPRFDPHEWERVQRLHMEELQQDEDEPDVVASRVARRTLFGDAHAYAWPTEGTQETVEKLTVDDARAAHGRWARPDWATLLVAGDLTRAQAQTVLEHAFGDWAASAAPKKATEPLTGVRGAEQERRPPNAAAARTTRAVVIVDRPEAVQTVICCVMPGPPYADAHRQQYRLLNTVLGGSFTSRLVQNLREAHGYTYGVHSSFTMGPSAGYFVASSSVRTDVTGDAVKELLAELRRIRGGDITADETAKASAMFRTGVIEDLAGLHGVLDLAAQPVAADLPFETVGQDFQALPAITADDLNRLAGTLPLDRLVLVLVGDKASISEQIGALGLPPAVETDERGQVIPPEKEP